MSSNYEYNYTAQMVGQYLAEEEKNEIARLKRENQELRDKLKESEKGIDELRGFLRGRDRRIGVEIDKSTRLENEVEKLKKEIEELSKKLIELDTKNRLEKCRYDDVYMLLKEGMSITNIAMNLGVSRQTIYSRMERMKKLGMKW